MNVAQPSGGYRALDLGRTQIDEFDLTAWGVLMARKGAFLRAGSWIMHGVYCFVTHPVNKVWVKDYDLKGAGEAFFEAGGVRQKDQGDGSDWQTMRNRWEYSHVARAVLALASLIALASAAVRQPPDWLPKVEEGDDTRPLRRVPSELRQILDLH